uniref:Syntaxin 6/10/61 N-terminal domain-containing protein n=1 Tax=Anser brachyrhynchus TaxID=132585 RepID=A0A8B9CQV2_9AVES
TNYRNQFYMEVQKAVNTAQGLFQRWTELLQDPSIATREEIDWTTNELRNNLRSIEWDLEDLDETINILSVVLWRLGRAVPGL